MVSRRRQQSSHAIEHPVRFYKVVALTFLVLTVALLAVVVFMSSKRVTVTIMTKRTPIELNSEVTMGGDGSEPHMTGVVSTTILTFEKTFVPKGEKTEPGIAEGTVTLVNESSFDQPLVATTRLSTPGGILFRLKERVVIPAHGEIKAMIYADQEGPSGNIPPISHFTIPGLNEEKQKSIYGKSEDPIVGGVKTIGVLSKEDIDQAYKEFEVTAQQQAEDVFRPLASEKHFVVHVLSIDASPDTELGKEVSQFHIRGTARVIAVFYDQNELSQWTKQHLLERAIDESEIVTPSDQEPTVSFAKYDEEHRQVTLNVFSTGMVTINPQSHQIDKELFFGKSKDELRRYLLSLDHVHGVDIEFKPAWIQSVPRVRDHVTVIVKEVR